VIHRRSDRRINPTFTPFDQGKQVRFLTVDFMEISCTVATASIRRVGRKLAEYT
jgi:hypothetical protein